MSSLAPSFSNSRPATRGLALLILSALLLLTAPAAWAESVRFSLPLDAATPQARQAALEQAFATAVFQDATRILPAPLPAIRAEALRRFLAPMSRDLVLSYQETPAHKPGAQHEASAVPPQGAGAEASSTPMGMDYEIEVNRPALRAQLQRLGLLSAGTRSYSLHLGAGVTEQELAALAELNLLMGLTRTSGQPAAPLDITLEKLPQGYYKAVLRHAVPASSASLAPPAPSGGAAQKAPLAADGADIPAVWRNLWAMLFAGKDFRPGGAARWLEVSGWRGVDGVLDFDRLVAGWDDCVQDAQMALVDLRPGSVSARWSVRVVNAEKLSARLRETLPARGLVLSRPDALLGGAAKQ